MIPCLRGIVGAAALLLPGLAAAAGGGSDAPIVIVADTRHLAGVQAWLGQLYNESHGGFAALTVMVIPVTGVAFGLLADGVLSLLGIDLQNRKAGGH